MSDRYCERCSNDVQSRSSLFCYPCTQQFPGDCIAIIKRMKRKEAAAKRKKIQELTTND